MNPEPGNHEANSNPFFSQAHSCPSVEAEDHIIATILEGSGGPENFEMTEAGLRFIRHLLAQSRPARYGFIPNFKHMPAIQGAARDFISRCGGASMALQVMHSIVQEA